MPQSVGRNDPCPCNSGKKFKHCHMRPFDPKEKFRVKVTGGTMAEDVHYESSDGKTGFVKVPHMLKIRLYMEPRDSSEPTEIDLLINEISNKIQKESNFLTQRISRLRHKLNGTKFYLQKFVESEDLEIIKISSDYKGANGEFAIFHPELTYSLESFLFQVKSTLDVLAQIIGYSFRLRDIHTYSNDGQILISTLKQNAPKELKDKAADLAKIIEKYRKWASDVIDMRDEVTHYSDLTGFSCFIRYPWMGGDESEIAYPSMPDGNRARTYIEETWKILTNLIKDVTPFIGSLPKTNVGN